MKKNILSLIFALSASFGLAQEKLGEGIYLQNSNIEIEGDHYVITADLDLSYMQLAKSSATLIAPYLTNSATGKTYECPGVAIYTRSRYYHCLRNDILLGKEGTKVLMESEQPYFYSLKATYPRMNVEDTNVSLWFKRSVYGCCGLADTISSDVLDEIKERKNFVPVFMFATPTEQELVKVRKTSGSAFIAFEVDKTDIQEDRANNRAELAKIKASIDSVRNSDYYKIREMTLTGYASPDGPYDKNVTLAQGRTEVMGNYLRKLYSFERRLLKTASVPEDWKGFRALVDTSSILPHRNELMDIIDNVALNPDQKEVQIKKFEKDYDIMRTEILPRLRHTDYTIEYEVHEFITVEECLKEFYNNPRNLSLKEFYKCTEGLDDKSPLFLEIWETAIKYFPDDEIANINVANAAMMNQKFDDAALYLDKAGNSAAANYARGNLAALKQKFEEARTYFSRARSLPEANTALEVINQILK